MYLYGENSSLGHAEQFLIEREHPLEKMKTDASARYLLGQPDGVYITRLSLRYGECDARVSHHRLLCARHDVAITTVA